MVFPLPSLISSSQHKKSSQKSTLWKFRLDYNNPIRWLLQASDLTKALLNNRLQALNIQTTGFQKRSKFIYRQCDQQRQTVSLSSFKVFSSFFSWQSRKGRWIAGAGSYQSISPLTVLFTPGLEHGNAGPLAAAKDKRRTRKMDAET